MRSPLLAPSKALPSPVPIVCLISPALLPWIPCLHFTECSCLPFLTIPPHLFSLASQVWERPIALGAELVPTLKGPGGHDSLIPGPHPGAAPSHDTPSKLQACVSVRGTWAGSAGSGKMGPHPSVPSPVSHTTLFCAWVWAQPAAGCRPQGLFQHWLQQLQEAPEKVSDSGKA